MVIVPEITGKRLGLRPVRPPDAAFIQGLRTDPAFNTHTPAVTGTVAVAGQRAWIIKEDRYCNASKRGVLWFILP